MRTVKGVDQNPSSRRETIARLRGIFKGLGLLKALEKERVEDRAREDAKLDRLRQEPRP
jgi:hypothetical protein